MPHNAALIAAALLLVACGKQRPAEDPSVTPGGGAVQPADQPHAVSTVRGRVVGHDGAPLAVAHVRALGTGSETPPEVKADKDGAFELQVPLRGLAQIEVTGSDHAAAQLVVVLDGKPLDISLELGTYEREDPMGTPTLTLWTEDPDNSRPQQKSFTKQSNGTFTAEIETQAERVWYQVSGTAGPGRIVNGPQSDAYQYDGGGDYRSIIAASGGKVRIVLDPAKLPPPAVERVLTLGDPKGPTARAIAINELADVEQNALAARMREANPSSPQEAQLLIDAHDFGATRTALLTALDAEEHPGVRHATLGAYFALGRFPRDSATAADRARAKELLGELRADDPGWVLFSGSMLAAADLSDDPRHAERMATLLEEELDPMIAGEVLFSKLINAAFEGDSEGARTAYTRLQTKRFAKTPYFFIAKQYDPDRAIQAGQKFPAFELAAISASSGKKEKSAAKITNEDLSGKVFLVDVWATWCKPCIAEMDNLHAAYDKFNTKRAAKGDARQFEILSVSVDKGPEEVADFRKNKFPMPWQHAHLSFDGAGELFGIAGIPYAVLLDETGTILATSPQVSGESLDRLLEDVLAKPKAQPE